MNYVELSKEKHVQLLLDNYNYYLCTDVKYYKENGVTVLPFPSQCSLWATKEIFPPSKRQLASQGETITIYDISEFVKISLQLVATGTNTKSGFRVTGLSPLHENISPGSKFSGSYVTKRQASTYHQHRLGTVLRN